MIPTWPPKPRYNTKKLREAIETTARADALAGFVASTSASARDAVERLQAMQDAVAKAVADIDSLRGTQAADITNRHLTNIRDDLEAVLDESARP